MFTGTHATGSNIRSTSTATIKVYREAPLHDFQCVHSLSHRCGVCIAEFRTAQPQSTTSKQPAAPPARSTAAAESDEEEEEVTKFNQPPPPENESEEELNERCKKIMNAVRLHTVHSIELMS